MDHYLTALKDILVVLTPIIVAIISYRTSKKTQKDIKYEVEKVAKEKEAETKQILDKIGAELESRKQLITWENSMPQTNEYASLVGTKRYGHISSLPRLCLDIRTILNSNPSLEKLLELNSMLDRIDLPDGNNELFPYEVPIIFEFKMIRSSVNEHIHNMRVEKNQNEETTETENENAGV